MQWFSVNAINLVGSSIVTLPFNFDHYWWRCVQIFESVAHNEPKQWLGVNARNPFGSSLVINLYNFVLNWYGDIPIYGHCWRICCASNHWSTSLFAEMVIQQAQSDTCSIPFTICIAVLNELVFNFLTWYTMSICTMHYGLKQWNVKVNHSSCSTSLSVTIKLVVCESTNNLKATWLYIKLASLIVNWTSCCVEENR